MAAFTKSGHTKTFRFAGLTGCFRPEADIQGELQSGTSKVLLATATFLI